VKVLITGGGSGIGAACARRFAARGDRVAINGRRTQPLSRLAGEIGAVAVPGDCAQPAVAEGIVAAALRELGALDCVVLSAGIAHSGTVLEQTPESWRAVIGANLDGAFHIARAALPTLIERRGSIVSVASASARRVGPRSAAYCTSKAAMVMLTQTIAVDFGALGVRANAVCPAWTRTPMADTAMDELAAARGIDREQAYDEASAAVPSRRPSEADEVAALIVWLASEEAGALNGAVIPVDGGAGLVDAAMLAFAEPGGTSGADA
jgi:meso-butanediol dehydrogenase / (S,S)-butanediol dehydrogenase / diacetyl reductase